MFHATNRSAAFHARSRRHCRARVVASGSLGRADRSARAGVFPRPPQDPLVGEGTPLPILVGSTWAYFKGTVAPPANWNTLGFNDASWLTGTSGIGYGDGDDATVLSDMQNSYTSVYTRRAFDVPNPAAIGALELRADYDDGFVAYLNGVEVARRNIPPERPPSTRSPRPPMKPPAARTATPPRRSA
jgi:hypothetical protein